MNLTQTFNAYPSVRPQVTEDAPVRQAAKKLVFAEEKSPSLMQHTLNLVRAMYQSAKDKKARFEQFNYEPELAQELIDICFGEEYEIGDLMQKLIEQGFIPDVPELFVSNDFAADDAQAEGLKSKINAVLDTFKNDELVIHATIEAAKAELGSTPGYKAFMDWVYKLLGVLDEQSLSKPEWFEQKNLAIDDLAYDYARYGLSPHVEIQSLSPAFLTRFDASYRAAKVHYGSSTKPHTPFIRKWISLRKSALTRGRSFDNNITPERLEAMVELPYCPVTGLELEINPSNVSETDDYRWSVERHSNDLGYSVANICVTSNMVNRIRGNLTCFDIFARAAGEVADDRLTQIQWARLGHLHFELCKRVEPYFGRTPSPLLWNYGTVGVVNRNNICQDLLSRLVDKKTFRGGLNVSIGRLTSQIRQIRWFDQLSPERLDMEIKRLFYVVRQQLKNDSPYEVNFALMYDVKDGRFDEERADFANQLVYLLAISLFGDTFEAGAVALDSIDTTSTRQTLQNGHYSDSGFFKGH